ncbi:MAG: NAD(P)-dependent oxidoreductase [Planctomycetaceae bacterium]
MKILFADALPEQFVQQLRDSGHECELNPSLSADDIPNSIEGVDVLVVRSTKVTAAAIEASDRLSLIVRAGAGTNNIDKQSAANAGIYVCNVPGMNAIAVAELAMGLLLSIDRRIPHNVIDLRAGQWKKKEYGKADGVFGKTMAIIGLGNIGLAVASRAKAFGIRVLGLEKAGRSGASLKRIEAAGVELVGSISELVSDADIVSLHVPASPETKNMVDAEFLGMMQPGSILLNTARGEVVDGEALIVAMNDNGIRAGLDTYPDEPGSGMAEYESELATHPNVVGTHHIGASTTQAQNAIAAGVIDAIDSYVRGDVKNCVNMETAVLGHAHVSVRHFNKVGVLASVFDVFRKSDLNVEQMENQIFAGSEAAVALIEVGGDVTDVVEAELRKLDDVISVSVHRRA